MVVPGFSIYEFTGAMVVGPGGPPSGPPPGCPPAPGDGAGGCGGGGGGDGSYDGEPVNLATGLFVYQHTDLLLPDVLPLEITRTYRQGDVGQRAFGIGTSFNYGVFIDDNGYTGFSRIDFFLPDGSRFPYIRMDNNTGAIGAVLHHRPPDAACPTCTGSPTVLNYSMLLGTAPLNPWQLRRRDGLLYKFGTDARLEFIRDRFDNTVYLYRNASTQGEITRIVSPNGRVLEFTHDVQDRVTEIKDNLARTVQYFYDAHGRLKTVKDAAGGLTRYYYDNTEPSNPNRRTRMTSIRLPEQNATCPDTCAEQQGVTCTDPCSGLPFLTNEYYVGGALDGMTKKQTLANGGTYEFTYTVDGNGKVTQTDVTDPRGFLRRVTFNAAGYVVSDTRAVGTPEQQVVTRQRDPGDHQVTSITDSLVIPGAGQRQTTFEYYRPGGMLKQITRLANTSSPVVTKFTYEPLFKQLASIEDPLQHTTTFEFDASDPLARLQSVTDPTNRRVKVTLDGAGRTTFVSDPFLVGSPPSPLPGTTFTYEGGDLMAVTDPAGKTTKRMIDAAGRVRAVTDPEGRTTKYLYDALDRMTTMTDPGGGMVLFEYDKNDNLKVVRDDRHVPPALTRYDLYDGMNRLRQRTDPLNRVETFDYDLNGNLKEHRDRRGVYTDFGYDGHNRRTCAGFGRINPTQTDCTLTANYESKVRYTYDVGDRLTTVEDFLLGSPASTVVRAFDGLDNLTLDQQPQGSVSYSHDGASRRTAMTVQGQATQHYCYDEADRLKQIRPDPCGPAGGALVAFSYDARGRREAVTLPNGVIATQGYDAASRINSMQYGTAPLQALAYTYDATGNRTSQSDTLARTGLATAVSAATYDAADQMLSWNGTSLPGGSHDANGNLVNDGLRSYTWNKRNQLGTVGGTSTAAFKYDGLGRRIERNLGGAVTRFLYDGLNPVQEQDGTNAVTADVLPGLGIDEFFRRTTGGPSATDRTFLTDALGSTIALTDQNQALQPHYRYEPFGRTSLFAGSTDSNAYQFTGRENDGSWMCQGGSNPGASCTSNTDCGSGGTCTATGLYYYRARYYAPTWGRFVSEDPLEFGGGDANLYRYVLANPINLTDPSGYGDVIPFPPGGRGGPRPWWMPPPLPPGQGKPRPLFPPPPPPRWWWPLPPGVCPQPLFMLPPGCPTSDFIHCIPEA